MQAAGIIFTVMMENCTESGDHIYGMYIHTPLTMGLPWLSKVAVKQVTTRDFYLIK